MLDELEEFIDSLYVRAKHGEKKEEKADEATEGNTNAQGLHEMQSEETNQRVL